MSRMVFKKSELKNFILKVKQSSNLNWDELGKLVGLTGRTIRGWRDGVLLPSEQIIKKLEKLSGLRAPKPIEIREEFWSGSVYGRKAAIARFKKYGPPGTQRGRRKGGIISQQRRQENPEKYKLLGCNVRKSFNRLKESSDFAELVGILLGDGAISSYQVRIYFNRKADYLYADFVGKLLHRLLGEKPSRYDYPGRGTLELNVSGIGLVNELSRWGLRQGDKIRRQVGFPTWINSTKAYKKACVRGLVDTDGCLFFHTHWINNRKYQYRHLGLCFTSKSNNLLDSVSKVLRENKINHSIRKGENIFVYGLNGVKKYLNVFGSHNPRLTNKLQTYLSTSIRLN